MKIINAAINEFVEHGYKTASTNNIVQAAGIGKGMLFYYFNSKIELYKFIVEYCITCLQDYFIRCNNVENNVDFIEKYRTVSKIKMESYSKNPLVFELLSRMFTHNEEMIISDEIKEQYEKLMSTREQTIKILFDNPDTSLFRTDIEAEKCIKYIRWCMEGYIQEVLLILKNKKISEIDFHEEMKKYDQYLDDLKILFYKQS